MTLVDQAIQFAAARHAGQVRDGDFALPYITHPVEVLVNLRHVGRVTDEVMLATAVLHDLLEETNTTYEEILEAFGEDVAGLVQELTRDEPEEDELEGLDKDEIYELRTKRFLLEIERMSDRAQTIKLADRLSNLREAKRTRGEKQIKRYEKQTELILKRIDSSVNPRLWEAVKEQID